VLGAAHRSGVPRVVMTSAANAASPSSYKDTGVTDETLWTDPDDPALIPYRRAKTLAERAAWDFIAKEGGALEMAAVNPVGVFGPVLARDYSTSILIVQKLLDGAVPGCPKVSFGVVDVRDVADLHLRAMTDPAARGERFLAVAGEFQSMLAIAQVLKRRLGPAAKRVPTREIPNWLVRVASLLDPSVKQILPELGKRKNATSAKATRILGWSPRSSEDAIVATAESMVRLGLLKDSPKA
jgi:nucleoside-diphosphate-sugar epimerase